MVDKDGLILYRSLRGTSNLESLHQYLTTSFGHTAAGPLYSDCLLTLVRHYYNWRMSLKNRPGFPQLIHYDGIMIDRINCYYETSSINITPTCEKHLSNNKMLKYLARRQETTIPFLLKIGIKTKSRLLQKYIPSCQSIS